MPRRVLRIKESSVRPRVVLAGICPRCGASIYRQSTRCINCGWIVEKHEILNAFGKRMLPGA